MAFRFPDPCGGPPVLSYLEQSMKLSHRLPVPAPPKLSKQSAEYYAPTFESDSEGDSDWEDDDSTITFHRRHISLPSSVSSGGTAKKSLLAIALERQSEAAAQPKRNTQTARNRHYNGPHVHFMDEPVILEESNESSAENLATDQQPEAASEQAVDQNPTTATEAPNTPRLKGFLRNIKQALNNFSKVNLKWRKPATKQAVQGEAQQDHEQQATATATVDLPSVFDDSDEDEAAFPSVFSDSDSASDDEEAEEEDPYTLFFGNNQDQRISGPILRTRNHHAPAGAASAAAENNTTTTTTPIPIPDTEEAITLTPVNHSTPISIPLTPAQTTAQKQKNLERLPLRTLMAYESRQISRAGPLYVPRSDARYIALRDADWVCCGCGVANSRFVFTCWFCKDHFNRKRCCDGVIGGVDGEGGFGLAGLW